MTREAPATRRDDPSTKHVRLEPGSERSEPVSSSRRPRRARNGFLASETKPPNSPKGRAKPERDGQGPLFIAPSY